MLPFAWWGEGTGEVVEESVVESLFVLDRAILVQIPADTVETILVHDRAILQQWSRVPAPKVGREYIGITEDALPNKTFPVIETVLVDDRLILAKILRTRIKTAREYGLISETTELRRTIPVTETMLVHDRANLVQIDRVVQLVAREYGLLSEVTTLNRELPQEETVLVHDRAIRLTFTRNTINVAREYGLFSEVTTLTELVEIDSCEINILDEDHFAERLRCRYQTGVSCESTRVERSINGGSWLFHQNMNTTPSSGPFISNWYNGSDGEQVRFRITPYPEDSQGGTPGSPCITNEVEIGVE